LSLQDEQTLPFFHRKKRANEGGAARPEKNIQ
jgi:hypothetical protein